MVLIVPHIKFKFTKAKRLSQENRLRHMLTQRNFLSGTLLANSLCSV